MTNPETLSRRFFTLVAARDHGAVAGMLHPDVTFTAVTSAFRLRGRADVLERFYGSVFSYKLYDAYATRFEQLSPDTVRVDGRLRWLNNGHLHDIGTSWTLVFKGAKLYRLASDTVRADTNGIEPDSS